jgi:hypothetical protein
MHFSLPYLFLFNSKLLVLLFLLYVPSNTTNVLVLDERRYTFIPCLVVLITQPE